MLSLTTIAGLLLAATTPITASVLPRAGTISITPHEQYSSSVGVLGCLINTNRVAYWPSAPDCNNLCVELKYQGRAVHLLKIDQSGGANDVSYDAWNFLLSGKSATESPRTGGGFTVDWAYVGMDKCEGLLHNGKLPFAAANSMNFITSCLGKKDSWVAKNYEFVNIVDPVCHYGWNEVCKLNLAVSNQPSCPHQLGDPHQGTGLSVTNIQYGTGKPYKA
ncbi:hypothetical protein HDV57DRAFT_518318 [Trichoderma longibrachiatum]